MCLSTIVFWVFKYIHTSAPECMYMYVRRIIYPSCVKYKLQYCNRHAYVFSWVQANLCLLVSVCMLSANSCFLTSAQILRDLFGTKISALLQARPEVAEGSAYSPTLSPNGGHGPSQSVVPQHPVPHHFLKFLSHQTKFNGRSRKSSARGCFGLKMDRIGIMSGLGC